MNSKDSKSPSLDEPKATFDSGASPTFLPPAANPTEVADAIATVEAWAHTDPAGLAREIGMGLLLEDSDLLLIALHANIDAELVAAAVRLGMETIAASQAEAAQEIAAGEMDSVFAHPRLITAEKLARLASAAQVEEARRSLGPFEGDRGRFVG